MSHEPGGYLQQVFSILGLRRASGRAGSGLPAGAEPDTAEDSLDEAGPGGEPSGRDASGASQQARDRQAFETGLQQFRTSRGLASYVAGRVHILHTDLLRERLGKRWPRLEHRIHEIIKGELKRRLSSHDLFTRVDDRTYVIVFGEGTELEAQVKIALLSERLLEKLFGEDEARQLEALGVQRLITQADGTIGREALQGIESLMAMLDRAQAGGVRPAAYHGSELAAGTRALPPQEIGRLVDKLNHSLDEIVGGAPAGHEAGTGEAPQGGPLLKVDRLRQLVRQLEQLEEAMAHAGPVPGTNAAQRPAQEEAALGWVRELRQKAERQLVFLHDRDPQEGEAGAAAGSAQPDYSYLPMWHAPSGRVGIYLCQAAVADPSGADLLSREARGDDDRDAVAAADRLMLRRVLDDIRGAVAEEAPVIVAAPLHFSSLQPVRSRARILELCRGLPEDHRSLLLWEIVGAPVESWSFSLPDILQQMKRFAPAVFLRLEGVENHFAEIRRAFRHLREAGIHAVGLDVGQLHGSEADRLALLDKLARGARANDLKCYGHGFESESLAAGAVGQGYQHLSGPAIAAPQPRPAGAQSAAVPLVRGQAPAKESSGAGD